LLLGGVLASQGHAPVAAVLAAGIGGAIVSDAVGYLVGRRWGRRVLDSTLGRFVKADHVGVVAGDGVMNLSGC
jgi:membrane protein DedA with SNARE-associated domain